MLLNGQQATTYTERWIFERLSISESFCVLFGQTAFSEDCHHGYDQPTWHLLKVNNKNTRKRFEICSKLTIKTPERRRWWMLASKKTFFAIEKCVKPNLNMCKTTFPRLLSHNCAAKQIRKTNWWQQFWGIDHSGKMCKN